MGQIEHLIHAIFTVSVDSDIASDLGECQHVTSWREFQVHHVLVKVDVGRLILEGCLSLNETQVCGLGSELLAAIQGCVGFYHL